MKLTRTFKYLALMLVATLLFAVVACSGEDTPAGNFSLSESDITLMTGQTKILQVNDLTEMGASAYTVFWTSDNPAVATVDSLGTVSARSIGSCNVVVSVRSAEGEETLTCAVTVTQNTLAVSGISFNASIYTVGQGQTLDLNKEIRLTPAQAETPALTWTSSNPTIAAVTSGLVVPISRGISTITVSTADGRYSATCVIQVSETSVDPTGISFEETTYSIAVGQTKVISAIVTPENATGYSITWTSSDPAVATVDGGAVTGYSEGDAFITATLNMGATSMTAECMVTVERITVEVPATAVLLAPDTLELDATDRLFHNFKMEVTPANCTQSASWATNNPDLIEIDEKTGIFTLKKTPTEPSTAVLITCTVGDCSATAVVYVIKQPTYIAVDPEAITLYDKAPKNTFLLDVFTDDTLNEKLEGATWTASDPTVATVDDKGNVTALKPGVCVITASIKKGNKTYTDTCTVTVEEAAYLTVKVGEEITIPAGLLPENPSTDIKDWYYLTEFIEINPETKTIKGIKASNTIDVQVNVLSADGKESAVFTVAVIAAEDGGQTVSEEADPSTETTDGQE